MTQTAGSSCADKELPAVTLREATAVWAKIGFLSFGGPAGQIALMHRILVDEKRWISEARFLHALNFCMLLPGPEAQQLATYVGWLLHRIRGGLIAGSLFILPGFVVILALSYVYMTAGNVPLVQGLFTGLKAAVVAIVLQAVIRIGRRTLRSFVPAAVALAAFLAMFVWRVPFPYVILSAAIIGAVATRYLPSAVHGDPGASDVNVPAGAEGRGYALKCVLVFGLLWLTPTVALLSVLGGDDVFANIGSFFSKMAVVTFGGAYAVLAYVSQEAVGTYQWLAPGEMIDGLAMAETTPGPLIMVTQFVGYAAAYRDPGSLPPGVAGFLGSVLTVWVTFVPCFLWIFMGAPYLERLRSSAVLSGALAGVTAAVVGVVVNLALWFSMHALFADVTPTDFGFAALELPVWSSLRLPALFIALTGLAALFAFRASVLTTLALTGVLGILTLWM